MIERPGVARLNPLALPVLRERRTVSSSCLTQTRGLVDSGVGRNHVRVVSAHERRIAAHEIVPELLAVRACAR
jgi:hypothetical protein